jgi:hypothetical protein
MTIAAFDLVRLKINGSGNYFAEVNGATIGSFGGVGNTGLMIQKMNGEFSFWSPLIGTANWTQVGGTATDNLGTNFASLHLFTAPGGGERYWGYVDNFQVQSFAPIPEPSVVLLLGLGGLIAWRRSRKV